MLDYNNNSFVNTHKLNRMKYLKIIALGLVIAFAAGASAQVVKKDGQDRRDKKNDSSVKVSGRSQAFYEQREPSDADKQWEKVVYRVLDLTKDKNAALYYPEEPNQDGQSMFYIIMRLLANDQVSAYEYLDGREMFTDEYRIKVKEMLDRFHILYTEAKGSNEKHPIFTIEDADIPGNEILSYYIIEKWCFVNFRWVDFFCRNSTNHTDTLNIVFQNSSRCYTRTLWR